MHVAAFTDMTPSANMIRCERMGTPAGENDRLIIVNLKLTDRVGGGITFLALMPALNFAADASNAADFLSRRNWHRLLGCWHKPCRF